MQYIHFPHTYPCYGDTCILVISVIAYCLFNESCKDIRAVVCMECTGIFQECIH